MLDQADFKAEQAQQVDQMLALIYALLGLAIFIALLGIGNTLALSILERIHELGPAAGGGHDPVAAALDDPLGVGDHRPPGHGARASSSASSSAGPW